MQVSPPPPPEGKNLNVELDFIESTHGASWMLDRQADPSCTEKVSPGSSTPVAALSKGYGVGVPLSFPPTS